MSTIPPFSSASSLSAEIKDFYAKNSSKRPLEDAVEISASLLNGLTTEALRELKASVLNGLTPEALRDLNASVLNGLTPEALKDLKASVLNGLSPEAHVDIQASALNNLYYKEAKNLQAGVFNNLSPVALGELNFSRIMLLPPPELMKLNASALNNLSFEEAKQLPEYVFNNLSPEAVKELGAHVLNNLSRSVHIGIAASVFNNLSSETLEKLNASVLNNSFPAIGIKASILNKLSPEALLSINFSLVGKTSHEEFAQISTFTLINLSTAARLNFNKSERAALQPETLWALNASIPRGFRPKECEQCISAFHSLSLELISQLDTSSFKYLSPEILGNINSSVFNNLSKQVIRELNSTMGVENLSPSATEELQSSLLEKLFNYRAENSHLEYLNGLSPTALKYINTSLINGLSAADIQNLKGSVINNLSPKGVGGICSTVFDQLSKESLWELDSSVLQNLGFMCRRDINSFAFNYIKPEILRNLDLLSDPLRSPDFFNQCEKHTLMCFSPDLLKKVINSQSYLSGLDDDILDTVGDSPERLEEFNIDNEEFILPPRDISSYSYIVSNLSERNLLAYGNQMLTDVSDAGAIHILRRIAQNEYIYSEEFNDDAEFKSSIRNLIFTIFHSRDDKPAFQDAVHSACPNAKNLLDDNTY